MDSLQRRDLFLDGYETSRSGQAEQGLQDQLECTNQFTTQNLPRDQKVAKLRKKKNEGVSFLVACRESRSMSDTEPVGR